MYAGAAYSTVPYSSSGGIYVFPAPPIFDMRLSLSYTVTMTLDFPPDSVLGSFEFQKDFTLNFGDS